jgi:hypothetical protein
MTNYINIAIGGLIFYWLIRNKDNHGNIIGKFIPAPVGGSGGGGAAEEEAPSGGGDGGKGKGGGGKFPV